MRGMAGVERDRAEEGLGGKVGGLRRDPWEWEITGLSLPPPFPYHAFLDRREYP